MGTPRRACAACSYRRRRCDPDFIFACYFNDHRTFANIDRLFGRVKAKTMIRQAPPNLREATARSISIEAEMRRRYPTQSCSAILNQLQPRIMQAEIELDAVRGVNVIEELEWMQYLNWDVIEHALIHDTPPYAGNEDVHGASTNPASASMQDRNTNNHEEFQALPRNNDGC